MIRACSLLVKDPANRISELENHCEALEHAIEEIQKTIWEPKITMPQLKRRVGQVLVAFRERQARNTP